MIRGLNRNSEAQLDYTIVAKDELTYVTYQHTFAYCFDDPIAILYVQRDYGK